MPPHACLSAVGLCPAVDADVNRAPAPLWVPQGARLPVRALVRALRPHQWVKNLLVFVPLIAAHRVLDGEAFAATFLTAVAFCLCASGIYVANDLLDVDADRQHPRKRHRPFAAGELSIPAGVALSTGLVAASFGVAGLAASWHMLSMLTLYVTLAMAYSLRLKREPVADVFVLAALYVLRILAGGLVGSIVLSTWLLAFAMFLFLSLAFVKRYTEVSANGGAMPGRGYSARDALWMHGIGTAAGYMAVVVLALYVMNAPEVSTLYTRPQILCLLCPVLLYWVTRIWFFAGRGQVHDDPVVAALRDPVSYAACAIGAAVLIVAV